MNPAYPRIVFAGTPEFASAALSALIQAQWPVVAVYTQPDRPAGRGHQLRPSPVKALALAHGIPVEQPESLRNEAAQTRLKALSPDLMIVAAYGLILPPAILNLPVHGCINIHASLLPRWRGAAPIQRAIEAGDRETGITIMQMDQGLDTGPMLLRRTLPIHPEETGGSLHDRLATLGAETLLDILEAYRSNPPRLTPEPQDDAEATYAHKLGKDDARIDWRLPAEQLERRIRAFNPWPIGHCLLQGKPIKLWAARVVTSTAAPGPVGEILAVTSEGIHVRCGTGTLLVERLQLPGGRPLAATDLLNGHPGLFRPGDHFD